jgi:hypothetical protein
MCQVNTNPMISQVGYLQVVGEFPSLLSIGFRGRKSFPFSSRPRTMSNVIIC